jgi:hypothetical protein
MESDSESYDDYIYENESDETDSYEDTEEELKNTFTYNSIISDFYFNQFKDEIFKEAQFLYEVVFHKRIPKNIMFAEHFSLTNINNARDELIRELACKDIYHLIDVITKHDHVRGNILGGLREILHCPEGIKRLNYEENDAPNKSVSLLESFFDLNSLLNN